MMRRGRGTLIALLVVAFAVLKFVRLKVGALVEYVVAEVQKARTAPLKPIAPDRKGNSTLVLVLVKPEDGPVVEAPNIKTPLPLSRVPVRSSKRDLERGLIAIAQQHSGKKNLTIAQARKYLQRVARENPNLELAVPRTNSMHDAAVHYRDERLKREAAT